MANANERDEAEGDEMARHGKERRKTTNKKKRIEKEREKSLSSRASRGKLTLHRNASLHSPGLEKDNDICRLMGTCKPAHINYIA